MAIATSTAIIAGAAIAGAGVVAGSAVMSSGAKQAAKTQAEAQQQAIASQEKAAADAQAERDKAVARKEEAVKNINYPTYLSVPEAQKYKGTLEERMAGRGLVDVNAQTAPVANQVRAGLEQTKAAYGSAASARGLGRSTVPVSQIGEASKAAERDIADRVAQLELTRQEQIGQAVSQYGGVSEQEAASQQNKAIFERGGEFSVADTIANNASATKEDQFAIARSIEAKGATEAASQLKQAEIWSSAIIGATKGAQQTTDEIVSAIENKQATRNAALVNIGPGKTTYGVNVPSRLVPLK